MPYYDINGEKITLYKLVVLEPEWAVSRIMVGEELADMYTKLENQLKEKEAEIAELKNLIAWYKMFSEVSDGG